MPTNAQANLQIENENIRVTEWRFAPGAGTGWHRHQYDYVVVPMTSGTLFLKEPQGDRVASLIAGQAYTREAGIEHEVVNTGPGEIIFVEIELKRPT